MPPKKQQGLDLHELQRAMLEKEMREEAGRTAATSAASRAAPPGRGGRPPRAQYAPGCAEGFCGRPGAGYGPSAPYPPSELRQLRPDGEGPGYYATRAFEAHAPTPPGRDLDVHELLKREAFASESAACDDHFEKSRPCPEAVHGISDQYIVFDTFAKLRESDVGRGEFRWNFMVQGVTGDQVLGVRDRIDTVIAIQVGAFTLPILPEVPYVLIPPPPGAPSGLNQLVLVHNNANLAPPQNPLLLPAQYPPQLPAQTPWVDNPYTQLPCGGHLTVQMREAGLQSYSDRNGARHHFEFGVAYPAAGGANPNMLTAFPLRGGQWDTFLFTDPLKDVHGLTLVFRNPDVPVRFLPDCLYEVSATSDGAVAPGPFLRFDAPGHGLLVGDRVFVEGFQSGVGVLDAYVNRPEGHVVSGDPSLLPLPPSAPLPTPDAFWLDPAVSLLDLTAPPPVLPQIVTVCIAKRRMRIPMRLRRVVQRLTNYTIATSS